MTMDIHFVLYTQKLKLSKKVNTWKSKSGLLMKYLLKNGHAVYNVYSDDYEPGLPLAT